ncbi:hypothetical protein HBI49_055990 [Parastagonospora nodorum]|nr:hypothetical protein HBH50_030130 [Parastagonospora nodorum]KAH4096867.1 hypothetical protein HBH48_039010 [Parastagonospora nodorum]KAH4120784.1 hypothetical protein HBH47_109040 [Parastagonospora nodorum]KAH4203748.1 hypothetical protein HBH42_005300 [Parastagonospora nodorum]KAH5374410.1 hypothetical protein HBI49_055990 [Parastagonospora nodorum]
MRSISLKFYAPASLESENLSPLVTDFRESTATKVAWFDHRLPTGFAVSTRTVSEISSKELEIVADHKDSGTIVIPPELVVTRTRLDVAKSTGAKDDGEQNAAPSPVTTTANGLMYLPRELRDEIYTHLMSNMPAEIQTRHTSGYIFAPLTYLPANALPPLASTNRQMHREVSLAWLRRTKLKIAGSSCGNYSCLYMFLEYLSDGDDEGFRSVRFLEYESLLWGFEKDPDGDFWRKAPVDIHRRCTGLRELTVQIEDPRLYALYKYLWSLKSAREPWVYMTPLSHFENKMQLGSIFDHPGRFKLKVVFVDIENVPQDIGMGPGELLAARARVLEGYRVARGSNVKLEIYVKRTTWVGGVQGCVEEKWMGGISREAV